MYVQVHNHMHMNAQTCHQFHRYKHPLCPGSHINMRQTHVHTQNSIRNSNSCVCSSSICNSSRLANMQHDACSFKVDGDSEYTGRTTLQTTKHGLHFWLPTSTSAHVLYTGMDYVDRKNECFFSWGVDQVDRKNESNSWTITQGCASPCQFWCISWFQRPWLLCTGITSSSWVHRERKLAGRIPKQTIKYV